jgi:TIGR03009 family protein
MRRPALALSVLLLTGTALPAQPLAPPQPAAPAPLNPNNPLDGLLLKWEQAMQRVKFLTAKCQRTDTDRVIGQEKVWAGKAAYLAPNFVRLYLVHKPGNAREDYEDYIINPQAIYELKSETKTVYIRQLPPAPPGQVANNAQMSLLFGMKAAEAKRRFEIKLDGEDETYYYLTVLPRDPQDRAEFAKARVALFRSHFLPREVRIDTPNQNQVKWELPEIDLTTPVNAGLFARPQKPEGWREQVIPLPQR